MTLMMSKLHEALLAAQVPPATAIAAAEEAAEYRGGDIRTKLRLLTCITTINTALLVVVVIALLTR